MNLEENRIVEGDICSYRIIRAENFSARSKSYLCTSADGQLRRLKLYDGLTTMSGEVRERYLQLSPCRGILKNVDQGRLEGIPFDVFPVVSSSLSMRRIPPGKMVGQLIPDLIEGLHYLHAKGILIRDLRPEHIATDTAFDSFSICSFSDIVLLKPPVTAVRTAEYGLDPNYLAPETSTFGFSEASDYYALGVLIYLLCFKEGDPNRVKESEWRTWKEKGQLPEFDKLTEDRYQVESYNIIALIRGLTKVDPRMRWTSVQVGEWLERNGDPASYRITPIRKKIPIPIRFMGKTCWGYEQIAGIIAENIEKLADQRDLISALLDQIRKEDARFAEELEEVTGNVSSPVMKWFCLIYKLDPEMPGFWMGGRRYMDLKELALDAAENQSVREKLSCVLREKGFSYWAEAAGIDDGHIKWQLSLLEEWEKDAPGAGVDKLIHSFYRRNI